jgi:diguanylate cyclase (GGDEF)-like protein
VVCFHSYSGRGADGVASITHDSDDAAGVSHEPIRIMLLDENRHDTALELRKLKRSGLSVEARFVTRENEYRAALKEFAPDVILSDFTLGDFDGVDALRIAGELVPGTPVILVSASVTEERAGIAARSGAVDYVLKTNLKRLPGAVRRAVVEAKEKARLRAAEEGVRRLSRVRDVLSAVNSAIVRIDEPAALYHEVCRIATGVGGFTVATIATVDRVTGTGTVHDLIGAFPIDVAVRSAEAAARDPRHARGILAEALRGQSPVVVNDVVSSTISVSHTTLLENAAVRAIACFPFSVEGNLVGGLSLGSSEPGFFNAEEVQLISGLTSNLSFALELASKRKRVEYLTYYDALTGLPNRALFTERLRVEIAAAARRNDRLALLVFDIAQLATINTTVGEWAGDGVLRMIAQRLLARTDPSLAARIAGDRFALLIPGLRSARDVMPELTPGGLALLTEPFQAGERQLQVTAHVGCALFPDDGADADSLFSHAQGALQSSRKDGSPYRFSAPALHAQIARRIDLQDRLRKAAAEQTFVLHYQPKVDVLTREIVGIEALMRWRDPERPDVLVSPLEFIPVLEESGLIVEVGRWALGEAVRQHHAWLEAGLIAPRIAVNVAAVQLRGNALVDAVREALGMYPGEAGLDLEVTESGFMGNVGAAIETLRAIRDLGVEIAVDDFGTGYSSLSYLFQLPISTLKIDRSFINGMTAEADKMTLVSAVISLARELRLTVVAEGVETEEQAVLLRLLRCDQMQGFLISRPLPPNELEPLLARR